MLKKCMKQCISREEMIKSINHTNYYRVSIDHRDRNYGEYQVEGDDTITKLLNYHSHNAVSKVSLK